MSVVSVVGIDVSEVGGIDELVVESGEVVVVVFCPGVVDGGPPGGSVVGGWVGGGVPTMSPSLSTSSGTSGNGSFQPF